MKKFFEKYDLFKIIGIAVLFTVLLTWLIPASSYSSTTGNMVLGEITRIGLNDFFTDVLLSVYYFAIVVTFLLLLGVLYQVLSKTSGYQNLVERFAKFLKGKELWFVLITTFVFALLASVSNEIYQLLIFVPFVITIVLKLKMDKITALATTFGGILIGLVGTTFSPMLSTDLNAYLSITYNTELITKIMLFVFTYGLFNFFSYMHVKKILKSRVDEVSEDKFVLPEKTEKAKIWPVIVILSVLAVYTIVGYISWSDAFSIDIFDSFNTWLVGLSIREVPVISYFLGTSYAFGTWDLYTIQMFMLLATGILALMYHIKLDDLIKSFGEGAKKMLKPILVVLLVYVVCIFTVMFPVMPTIVAWIMGAVKSVTTFGGVLLTSLSAIISSVFNVELRYSVSSLMPYFANVFGNDTANPVIAIIFQSFYGFVQFFAPTSLMLMLGLSYLEIPYKEWFKYIWKFVVGLFVIILLIVFFITFL